MLSVFSVLAFLSIFESSFTQNQNETAQIEIGYDPIGDGASFARNLTASVSVFDTDIATTSSDIVSEKVNISDRIEGTVEKTKNIIEFNTRDKINESEKNLDQFRPSPQVQVEPHYEFNKFPVKPAYPEAKTVSSIITSDDRNSFARGEAFPAETDHFQPGMSAFGNFNNNRPFGESQLKYKGVTSNSEPHWNDKNKNTDDTPWVSRVKFPSGPSSINQNPYPYVATTTASSEGPRCCQDNVDRHQNGYLPEPSKTPDQKERYSPPASSYGPPVREHSGFKNRYGPNEEFNFNKLVDVPKKYYPSEHQNEYHPYEKTYEHSYNLMEKPAYEAHEKTYSGGYNPWKKILKLFATFIPIGLLISALTPTVITVTPTNNTTTQSRYRSADDPKKELQNHILSSLDYFNKLNENGCEYRVFCELLVSASTSEDSEKHVKNLLDSFAEQEIDYKTRAEELKKVFEAVRNQDCNPISCEYLKNHT
ncbi:unnamed protein product [Ceutorhynchus assimilis]|uniref:Uncharacterized protein n=1 Tax=Ceutorhynchus assimilis TaxID=467358 RepID=A0A9N9ML61_9CUCU|nr:unnamed protein product [Ceutorhynchus assimilis]